MIRLPFELQSTLRVLPSYQVDLRSILLNVISSAGQLLVQFLSLMSFSKVDKLAWFAAAILENPECSRSKSADKSAGSQGLGGCISPHHAELVHGEKEHSD